MKKFVLAATLTLLAFSMQAAAEEKPAAPATPPAASEFKTPGEKLSYAIGMDVGTRMKDLQADIDLKVFMRGLEDTMKGNKPLLTQEEAFQVKKEFFDKKKEEQEKKNKELGEKNLKEGQAFLDANKSKPGIVTTASGLQYQVLQEGTGPMPTDADKVSVNYKGTLLDGTEFDSSYKRGKPASFGVKGVIPGWTEALKLMKVGAKYKLFIPSNLAYGERGAGKDIGPNSVLIFEVELISIEPQEAKPAPAPAQAKPAEAPKEAQPKK